MPWINPGHPQPGEIRNPNGRPVGSRNIRTQEILDLIRAQGHQDPLVTLSELQAKSEDENVRATAANMLAPYMHSKLAAKPQAPDPIYMEQAVTLPRPTTIRLASDNIALLSEMKAQGKIDIATADSLINDNRIILDALIDEQKLLTAQGGAPEQTIRITGGLPLLPGTNVIMPNYNGNEEHAANNATTSSVHDFNAGSQPGQDFNAGHPPGQDFNGYGAEVEPHNDRQPPNEGQ